MTNLIINLLTPLKESSPKVCKVGLIRPNDEYVEIIFAHYLAGDKGFFLVNTRIEISLKQYKEINWDTVDKTIGYTTYGENWPDGC